jgi:putative pyruvate formate lyase activating enzyme
MHRQVGDLVIDERGLAVRGLLVRHLVMPDALDDTAAIMQFLSELSPDTFVNIMAQYHPANLVTSTRFAELNRRIRRRELVEAYESAAAAGLHRFDPG